LSLVKALKENPTAGTAEEWADKVQHSVPSIPKEHLKDIVTSISSMKNVQKSAHVDAARFSSDIWDALEEDSPDLAENIDPKVFKSRTEILLNGTDLYLTSVKVKELRTEVERSFYGVRILTDLRTVFGDDPSQRPAMTPIHTLEIKYHHESGQHREFYVSLDDDDLVTLKEVVERAQQKKSTLVELLKKAEFDLYE
jgi:hypothetical protein